MYLIVGLGNPGKDYENTRHNLGFLVAKGIALKNNWTWHSSRICQAVVAQGHINQKKICLMLPLTYMNNSGSAINQIVQYEKIDLENILIVCDDLNIPFGQLRLRSQGTDGGHKGLRSTVYHLETNQFARLRIGIAKDIEENRDTSDYVLSEFNSVEKKELKNIIEEAGTCCMDWLEEDIQQVMNRYNKK